MSDIRSRFSALAVLAAAAMAMGEPSQKVGPGDGSKGVARGRQPIEPNEHTARKKQSDSLKRLLRK